jgi:hypothetical protein
MTLLSTRLYMFRQTIDIHMNFSFTKMPTRVLCWIGAARPPRLTQKVLESLEGLEGMARCRKVSSSCCRNIIFHIILCCHKIYWDMKANVEIMELAEVVSARQRHDEHPRHQILTQQQMMRCFICGRL